MIGRPLVTLAIVALCALTPAFGADHSISSKVLLEAGFVAVATGDLLVEREFGGQVRMDSGIFVHGDVTERPCIDDILVAVVPGQARDGCGVSWWRDRYDTYVRMKKNDAEFVCILGSDDQCWRASP